MNAYRFDHVHLRARDPAAAAAWFETMFAAAVTRDTYPPGTLYAGQPRFALQAGGMNVLIAPAHPDGVTGPAPAFPFFGLEHFGFTVDDVDAAVAELRAKGAEIVLGPVTRSAGLRLAFLRGPEGMWIELVQQA